MVGVYVQMESHRSDRNRLPYHARGTGVSEIHDSKFLLHGQSGLVARYRVPKLCPHKRGSFGLTPYESELTIQGHYAAEIRMRASLRDRGFGRIVISTSRSSAVRKCIKRSTENPSSR